MATFPLHTTDTAPAAARERLEAVQSRMGFIPNLFGQLAESPAALEAYQALTDILGRTSFSPAEQQIILLSASVENGCEFCVAAHTAGARKANAPETVVDAIRDGDSVPDERLGALATFTQRVVRDRGWVDEATIEDFLAAGFTRENVLEVLVGISLKTLSNYANHITGTPLNEEIAAFRWSRS
ncbi:carboxymuconolactone decarboxylase family protein [Arhodomonas sp. AD133]|uniref:carboxymuconolactone decarboxylase family protein n=1 Tax=Arhodomonas sp. AD133 TaxID=3415009 RepID=UPI003EB893C3